MKKLLFAFWLTLQVGLNAYSQIWQSYKGIWLKGYDNATQAPIPPTGYSALTYFADSLGTYVYDWDSLAWLRIPGAGGGGGGGGIVTADNGLIVSPAGNVRLGGTMLDQPTQITFDNNSTLEFFYPNGQGTIFSDNLFGTALTSGGSDYFIAIDPNGSSGLGTGVAAGIANGATLELLPTSGTMRMGANSVLQYNANDITISKPTTGTLGGTLFMNNSVARLSAASGSGIQSFQLGTGETATLGSSLGSTFTFNNASTNTAIISTPATFRLDGGTGFIVNAGSTVGNLSKATFTPTSLQLAVTDNFSFSNSFDLTATAWNINIPTANFSANASSTIWTQGSGGQSTSIELTHATESATLRSTQGSQISFDVAGPQTGIITFTPDNLNSTNSFRINNASTNGNASIDFRFGGTTQIGISQGAATSQMSIDNNSIISGGGADFTIGTSNGPNVILLKGGTSGTIILERTSGSNGTVNIFGGGGQAGTSEAGESILIRAGQGGSSGGSGGNMTIRGGSGGSAGAAGGNTNIISGQGNGGGPDGNIIIDALTGFLILSNLPTSDPCGSAPTGTVWSDSGTLKVCP